MSKVGAPSFEGEWIDYGIGQGGETPFQIASNHGHLEAASLIAAEIARRGSPTLASSEC